MKTIWKYPLETVDAQVVKMPKGAIPLAVQVQDGEPCLWALVDPEAPPLNRGFAVYGSGHSLPDDHGSYIGTYQLAGGALVFHVFERGVA